MSSETNKYLKFGAVTVLIIVSLGYLAYTGVQDSKSYYVTIKELQQQGPAAYSKRLRVAGNVVPGSIKRSGTRVDFMLKENDLTLPVSYTGTEAPPDTFKDDSQALADGNFGRDGVFHAKQLQAKCASKYAPQQVSPEPLRLPNPARACRRIRIPDQAGWRTNFHSFNPLTEPTPVTVITVSNLIKQFGRFAALRGVTAEFSGGKLYAILGDNGAGKTTLLRTLAGLNQPSSGEVTILGAKIVGTKKFHDICQQVGYMAHPSLLYDEMSGMENLAILCPALRNRRRHRQ